MPFEKSAEDVEVADTAPQRPDVEGYLRHVLAETYDAAGVDIVMLTKHDRLAGRSAATVIKQLNSLLDWAESLSGQVAS